MADKPKKAFDYRAEQAELARATCLYVATKLGDLMDEVVVVGGIVPLLLIDQDSLPEGTPAHVGTMDLDVGLAVTLLAKGRYRMLTERLRDAVFAHDQTPEILTCRRKTANRVRFALERCDMIHDPKKARKRFNHREHRGEGGHREAAGKA